MAKHDDDVELIRDIPAVPSILKVVSAVTGMGFAAVARVTDEHWVACEVLDNIDFGLKPGGELRIETTICNEIRDHREAVVIRHVAGDPVYNCHHTPAMYGFQSYISIPIILSDKSFFGTLCAIDPRPNPGLTDEVVAMFRLFAELIATHIDARRRYLRSEQTLADHKAKLAQSESELQTERADHAVAVTELADERDTSGLREQFIAVLGHDLRNPLAAIDGGVKLLIRRAEDERSQRVLQMMSASVLRMSGLISNVMDFARGRLGGGIPLDRDTKSLEPTLQTVIDEIRSAHPARLIATNFHLDRPFDGDHARLAQLFSNLLGNAVTHGAEDRPITVDANISESGLRLVVSNAGSEIPTSVQERLFRPFQRGEARQSLQGLGLGLYIASEIAKAHGGTLRVVSTSEQTQFITELPVTGGA